MVPIMWKFPTKPWFLRGCLILGGRDYNNYIYISFLLLLWFFRVKTSSLAHFSPLHFVRMDLSRNLRNTEGMDLVNHWQKLLWGLSFLNLWTRSLALISAKRVLPRCRSQSAELVTLPTKPALEDVSKNSWIQWIDILPCPCSSK